MVCLQIAVLMPVRDRASADARRMTDRHIAWYSIDIRWHPFSRLRTRGGVTEHRDGLALSPAAATAGPIEQFLEATPGAAGSRGVRFFESDPRKIEVWRLSFCRAMLSRLALFDSATTSISGNAR
jgi:hypothetical protein